jgi:hypothetical protein
VPWAATTATDTGSHEPPAAAAAVGKTASAEVAARLERLGYR